MYLARARGVSREVWRMPQAGRAMSRSEGHLLVCSDDGIAAKVIPPTLHVRIEIRLGEESVVSLMHEALSIMAKSGVPGSENGSSAGLQDCVSPS